MIYFVEDLHNTANIKCDIDNEQETVGKFFNSEQDLKDYFEYTGCKISYKIDRYNSVLGASHSVWDTSGIQDILLGYYFIV